MKRLDVPIILANTRGERHACGGRCSGNPRKDGYCYHDGSTKHRIGQCREAHLRVLASEPPTTAPQA